jgi:hypothetical protein
MDSNQKPNFENDAPFLFSSDKCEESMSSTAPVKKEKIPFWFENPNVLLNPLYLYEFFPNEDMTYEQKLNAVSRTVIVLTLAGFAFSQKMRIVIIGVITLVAISILFFTHRHSSKKEGFEDVLSSVVGDLMAEKKIIVPADVFDEATPSNPFSNVLVTDYEYNVHKKPAPPIGNGNTSLEQAKKMVIEQNATQPDIADKLFKNLGDEYEFEQSMRSFVSQPGTTIPNDQAGFADFLYGGLISGREGNMFALARQKSNYNLY